jgi:lysophospholipase L1-like esterase
MADLNQTDLNEEEFIEDFKKGRVIHILFICAFIVIVIVAVSAFLKWDKGIAPTIDPDLDSSLYEYESQDFIMEVGPSLLEGREDDGITTVLFLGDDYLSDGRGTDSIPDLVASKIPNSKVINASFSGSTLSNQDILYDFDTCQDAFSPYWIVNAMVLKDYTIMGLSLDSEYLTIQDETYQQTYEEIKTVDLNEVDVLVMMYGVNDYLQNRLVTNVADLNDIRAYSGAFQSTVDMIQENYPHIRIIFSSPTISFVENAEGELVNTNIHSNDYAFQVGYNNAINATIVNNMYVSYVDNYYGNEITHENYSEYLSDNWHLNKKGRDVIAAKLSAVIDGKYFGNQ